MIRIYNGKGANIIGTTFFRLILILTLMFTVACSDNEESLKIVIEDSPTAVIPETIDPPNGAPPPPTQPLIDADTPPTTGGVKPTPGPLTTTNALTMSPLDVMLKLSDNKDYKRITSNLPVRVAIHGLPQNRAWSVNVMFQKIELMNVVIDDNTGEVIMRDVQKEHDIRTLARRTKHGAKKIKNYLGQLELGYSGALSAALTDERFPNIDNTKRITIIVVLGRGSNKPVWHVVYVIGEDEPNVIATIDDSGSVLSVKKETRRTRK